MLDYEVMTEGSPTPGDVLKELQNRTQAQLLDELFSLALYAEAQELLPQAENVIREQEQRFQVRREITETAQAKAQEAEQTLRQARADIELVRPSRTALPEQASSFRSALEKETRASHVREELQSMLQVAKTNERTTLETLDRHKATIERLQGLSRPETPLLWTILQTVREPKGDE